MRILPHVNSHEDLLKLSAEDRVELCKEIRQFLVSNVSRTGGHLASNLGTVELSVAIETVFNTMEDRLVFDVGHQSYVHKMLTGRQADFERLRQFGGMSGYPKPNESQADSFVAGHASSSVSIALGMARARTLRNEKYSVVALIGDGAATGGMAYEGLNDAAAGKEPLVIILNDNEMSIDRNVGGLARHLSRVRSGDKYLRFKQHYRAFLQRTGAGRWVYNFTHRLKDRIKRLLLASTIFENMGLTYLGPVDGHDVQALISVLKSAKAMNAPVLVHVMTKKGHGYAPAEQNPAKFHGIGKFDPKTGETLGKKTESFSDSFGQTMISLAGEHPEICAITAAMPGGTGLIPFRKQFPNRLFDVGIAEEHAVSMAGGLAKQGMIPVVALYSTFLQRAFDQMMQDTAILGLHVVFAVDRAGLVGDDGETHHGIFDVGFLRQIPGMKVLCPVSLKEQQDMLRWAALSCDGPVAVRYPRGGNHAYTDSDWVCPSPGDYSGFLKCHCRGEDVTLVTYGSIFENVMEAARLLEQKGIQATVIRLLSVSPLPSDALVREIPGSHKVVVVEEISEGSAIARDLAWSLRERISDCQVRAVNLGQRFIPHGSISQLYRACGLDAESIAEITREVVQNEN